jgi:hypothetical protein
MHDIFKVQQFAVWTVTENPSRDGYTGPSGSFDGGPTPEEMAQIKTLLTAADRNPADYRAYG